MAWMFSRAVLLVQSLLSAWVCGGTLCEPRPWPVPEWLSPLRWRFPHLRSQCPAMYLREKLLYVWVCVYEYLWVGACVCVCEIVDIIVKNVSL